MRRGLDCSHTLKALLIVRHASERGHRTLEGVPDNELDGVPNALGWRLGRSNSAILLRESRDKKRQWRFATPSARPRRSSHSKPPCSSVMRRSDGRRQGAIEPISLTMIILTHQRAVQAIAEGMG